MSEYDELVKKLRVLAEVAPQKAAYAIELLVHERDKLKWSMEWYEDRAEAAEAEVERLKGVLEKIGECDHERVTKEVYRRDGAHSKLDKCDHGRRMYEDCDECTAAFARSALEAKP